MKFNCRHTFYSVTLKYLTFFLHFVCLNFRSPDQWPSRLLPSFVFRRLLYTLNELRREELLRFEQDGIIKIKKFEVKQCYDI